MKTKLIKFFLISTSTLITLVSLTPVRAEVLAAAALEAPLSCTISGNGNKSLTIEADHDTFPETIPCPFGGGSCSKWSYRFTWVNMNPSLAFVDLSSDLDLYSISDGGHPNPAGNGDSQSGSGVHNYDLRWIKWTANEQTYDFSFITNLAEPRVASAGGKSGNFEGFCLIQGAGVPVSNEFAQDVVTVEKRRRTADGEEICTKVNPVTQCEVAFSCDTGEEIPGQPIEEVISVHGDQVFTASVPGADCATFTLNNRLPNTYYICSGGTCYPI